MSENVMEKENDFQQLDNEFTRMLSIVHKRKARLRHSIKVHQKAKKLQYKQRLQFIIAKLNAISVSIPEYDDNKEEAVNNDHKKNMHSRALPLSLKYEITEVQFDAETKQQLNTMVDHFGSVVQKQQSKPNPNENTNANTIANSNTNVIANIADAHSQCQTIFELLLSTHASNTTNAANKSCNLLVLTLVLFHVFRFAIGKNQYIHEARLQIMIERVLAADYNRSTNDHSTTQYIPSVFNLIGMQFTRYLQLLHTHHICQISMVFADQIMLCEKVFMSTAFDLMVTTVLVLGLNIACFNESELGLIRDTVRRHLPSDTDTKASTNAYPNPSSVSMAMPFPLTSSQPLPEPNPRATTSANLKNPSPNPSEWSPFQAQGLNMNVANVRPNNNAVMSMGVGNDNDNKHGDGDGDDESLLINAAAAALRNSTAAAFDELFQETRAMSGAAASSSGSAALPWNTTRGFLIVSFFLYYVFKLCQRGYAIKQQILMDLIRRTLFGHPYPSKPLFCGFRALTALGWAQYLALMHSERTFFSSHVYHNNKIDQTADIVDEDVDKTEKKRRKKLRRKKQQKNQKQFGSATVKLDGMAHDSDMNCFMNRAVFRGKGPREHITAVDLRMIQLLANNSALRAEQLLQQSTSTKANNASAAFIAHIPVRRRGCEPAARVPLRFLNNQEKAVVDRTAIATAATVAPASFAAAHMGSARPSSSSSSWRAWPASMTKKTPTPKVAVHAVVLESQPLTLAMLAKKPAAERKDVIGNRLFSKIQCIEPRLAGKITGMLLEMENSKVLALLTDEAALLAKVNEALAVLKEHSRES